MKLITWNVNGIRAVERKGELQRLVESEQPDMLLLQEIKGQADQFSDFLARNPDYHQFYHSALKKGYAGTGLWVRQPTWAELRDTSFTREVDQIPNADEGRIAQLDFQLLEQPHSLLSVYFPNGGKSQAAWEQKLVFYDRIHEHMNYLRQTGRVVIVGGDMNVAHTEIDIARPKENEGKIGFHPDERAWMDRLHEDGWVDVWRARHPGVTDVYSWWAMTTRARERNVGWRIDYFLMDAGQLDRVKQIDYIGGQLGSDHCPLRMVL